MMADDEVGDEVKVFRRDEDADDDTIGESSEQQLADDKKEAVLEAELEAGRAAPSIIGGDTKPGSAFIKPEPSPSFQNLMPGLMHGNAFSPNYAFPMIMPFIMSPSAYGLRPGLSPNFMLPMHALSPSFNMFPGNPFYGAAAMAAAKQHLENAVPLAASMRGQPLNPLNQMRMPPYLNPSGSNGDKRSNGGGKIKKEDHIKKPLNAFMWFMKENRKKLLDEIGNNEKQSAELNKELGKRWHDLPKEEQQKYFDLAKKDREDHKQKYPQWSARENYAVHKKNKKKRRDKSVVSENSDQKKCRARFGVNNQEMWCKFCKRKKKCEYSMDRGGSADPLGGGGSGSSGGEPERVFSAGSLGRSPVASSLSRSPLTANASDSESDIDDDDEDEEVDVAISQQAREVIMQEMCPI
ncbi:unnamed protein product [Caenorhabditis bovis]|uniref:Protein pop-1 n=1 Tax=Caenorhabditis bovis TaxID=2654633 RepID=A0A8S1EUJ2_9PELO|nr:unnamed protein product [Caenorhabditis bovis]